MLAPGWRNPFKAPGAWRKANLHAHTTHSDGRVDLQTRVNEYAAAGWDVLAITDHHAITDLKGLQTPPGFVVLPGAELHPGNPFGGDRYHLVCLNVEQARDARTAAHPQEVIDEVTGRGGLVYFAHPYWCKHKLRDFEPLSGYTGFEVYNHGCRDAGRPDSGAQWDDLLAQSGVCPCIATDDCHGPGGASDTYGGWTWIRTEERSREAAIEALRAGMNYSSSGPEILALEIEDAVLGGNGKPQVATHRITVRTSPVREIFFVSDVSGSCCEPDPEAARGGATIAEGSFVVRPGCRYVRVEILDHAGRKAWSNPIPFAW
ncbi:MAG: hypothetical protein AMXMBFR7_41710 [Planctomycetota bacterium]